jgi:deoxyribodipyrimidine photolyase
MTNVFIAPKNDTQKKAHKGENARNKKNKIIKENNNRKMELKVIMEERKNKLNKLRKFYHHHPLDYETYRSVTVSFHRLKGLPVELLLSGS